MKIKLYIITIGIVIIGCKSMEQNISELPLITVGLEDDLSILKMKITELLPISEAINLSSLLGKEINPICEFRSPEIDSSILREFRIFLVKNNDTLWSFYTVNKQMSKILDTFSFNKDIWKLERLYSHSSKLGRDNVAIEFYEDKSSLLTKMVFEHGLEVYSNGEIEYIGKSEDFKRAFFLMSSMNEYSGRYLANQRGVKIDLQIRDGEDSNSCSYLMQIETLKGCINTFQGVNVKLENNTLAFDEERDFIVKFSKDSVRIINNTYEICNEKDTKLNTTLAKILTDDKFG